MVAEASDAMRHSPPLKDPSALEFQYSALPTKYALLQKPDGGSCFTSGAAGVGVGGHSSEHDADGAAFVFRKAIANRAQTPTDAKAKMMILFVLITASSL
jgi:hypothetical protein